MSLFQKFGKKVNKYTYNKKVLFSVGKWEKPFEAKLTEKASFQVDENTKVEVDMMKRTGRFDFFQDPDNFTSVIMLPYKGNTSMMVILPDEGKMKTVESYLNKDYIKHWHDSMFRRLVSYKLINFDECIRGSGLFSKVCRTAF